MLEMKRIAAVAAGLLVAAGLSVAPAQAATCSSVTAEVPYKSGGLATAHTWLNCNGPMSGWVKSSLVRVRTGLPDWTIATNSSGTQNSSYNFHAYASGCDSGAYGYKSVADSSVGYTATSSKVTISC